MKFPPTYGSFEEKAKNFRLEKIDTISDFEKFVKRVEELRGIFRGISSSKYKIYTSLQRKIIEKDLAGKFSIEKYIRKFREHVTLSKYFDALRIEPSKLSIFSFLQHFEAPSPFVDFTYNLQKALYFATETYDEAFYKDDGTMNDYFSIFFIEESDFELIEIPEVIRGLKEFKRLTYNLLLTYEDFTRQELIQHVDNIFSIKTLKVFLLKHYEDFVDIYNAQNNIRIVAQEGLFIYNDYQDKPLEEALKEFFIEATIYQASQLDDSNNLDIIAQNDEYMERLEKNRQFQKRLANNIIHSFEIRKSLIPAIKPGISINKEDICPDPITICKQIFDESQLT